MVKYFPQTFYSVLNLNNKPKAMAIQLRQIKTYQPTNKNRSTKHAETFHYCKSNFIMINKICLIIT